MTRPLVLVHGLWDTPRLFHRLVQRLDPRLDRPLLIPHLPHGLGVVPLRALAAQLDQHIHDRFGPSQELDLLGFSMGGVIARIWLQERNGSARVHRFFSVGSPQNGTLAAVPLPRRWLAGAADMKIGSALLRDLNRDVSALDRIICRSYFSPWVLIVCPGWRAVLPRGQRKRLPVWTHQQLIAHPVALDHLVREIEAD